MARIENIYLRLMCFPFRKCLDELESFVEKANNFQPTIKFTAEMSETEITFSDRQENVERD